MTKQLFSRIIMQLVDIVIHGGIDGFSCLPVFYSAQPTT